MSHLFSRQGPVGEISYHRPRTPVYPAIFIGMQNEQVPSIAARVSNGAKRLLPTTESRASAVASDCYVPIGISLGGVMRRRPRAGCGSSDSSGFWNSPDVPVRQMIT